MTTMPLALARCTIEGHRIVHKGPPIMHKHNCLCLWSYGAPNTVQIWAECILTRQQYALPLDAQRGLMH